MYEKNGIRSSELNRIMNMQSVFKTTMPYNYIMIDLI